MCGVDNEYEDPCQWRLGLQDFFWRRRLFIRTRRQRQPTLRSCPSAPNLDKAAPRRALERAHKRRVDSEAGKPICVSSRRKTSIATRVPASRQTRATARTSKPGAVPRSRARSGMLEASTAATKAGDGADAAPLAPHRPGCSNPASPRPAAQRSASPLPIPAGNAPRRTPPPPFPTWRGLHSCCASLCVRLAQHRPLRTPPAMLPVPLSTCPSFRSHPSCTAPLSERPCGLLMRWICPSACPAKSLCCNPRPLLRKGSFSWLWGLR